MLQPPQNSPPGLDLKRAAKTAFGGSGRLCRFRDPKAILCCPVRHFSANFELSL
jgi:hypothetical protein